MKKYNFILAIIIGVALGLTSHIYILKITDPILAKLSFGHTFPSPDNYPFSIVFWAYLTAIEQVFITTAVYYFVGDLLKVKNKFYKIFIFSFILLELKGSLIRQTIMNALIDNVAGITQPIMFSVLSLIDQWIAAILLIIVLVFICPTKKYNIKSN